MGVFRNDAHDRESLSSDLHAVLAKEFYRWLGHNFIQAQSLDSVNYWCLLGTRGAGRVS